MLILHPLYRSKLFCRLLCLLILCVDLTHPVYAAGNFSITAASAKLTETQLNARAQFSLKLNDTTVEALHNGIPVTLSSRLNLLSKRPLIWNKSLATWQQRHIITYHSLSDRYQLKSTLSDDTLSFVSLRELLSSIESYQLTTDLIRETMPKSSRGYQLRLRIRLDVEALPPALRVVAYAASSWRLKSAIRTWSIKPSAS